jgi:hypothetical protein
VEVEIYKVKEAEEAGVEESGLTLRWSFVEARKSALAVARH